MSEAMTPDRAKLVELAEAGRTSLASLSAMLGRNPSYLQQFVRKGSPRKLEEADRRRLAEFFGVSEVELGAHPTHAHTVAADEFITVPRLPLDASAGPGAFSAEEISFDSFRFSRRWLREMGLEGADLSAIRVEGDSMEPTLRSGTRFSSTATSVRARAFMSCASAMRCTSSRSRPAHRVASR